MSGILSNSLVNEISNEKYFIQKKDLVGLYPNNEWRNTAIYDDNWSYINVHATELKNIEFNSILIFGLGIGLTPFLYQNKCTIIDIIEIDEYIIDINNKMNLLKDNVKINYGNALDFSFEGLYDLIFVDIFGFTNEEYFRTELKIIENCNKNLNQNGKIYFPDSKTIYKK